MYLIKRIKIENIKGKKELEIKFSNPDIVANKVNIIVAPNGYGKTTLATAFKAAMNGKMKLEKLDYYNIDNIPKLEIDIFSKNKGEINLTVTDKESDVNKKGVFINVINSLLYAKSTTKLHSKNIRGSADLRLKDIVVLKKIPTKTCVNYNYSEMKKICKDFKNIESLFSEYECIEKLINIKKYIYSCCNNAEKVENDINSFINTKDISYINSNKFLNNLLKHYNNENNNQSDNNIYTIIQLYFVFKNNKYDILDKTFDYLGYKKLRKILDDTLSNFNTTGRNFKSHEIKKSKKNKDKKLLIKFDRANSMSNGERDVLSFIANVIKFEVNFHKNIGILVIDEIFDYLDGANMLAVQHYLSELIDKCKEKKKYIFPIIFTHLDPKVFDTFYFSKKKIHYLYSNANDIDMQDNIIKLLKIRNNDNIKYDISKYYLHYHYDKYTIPDNFLKKELSNFSISNEDFYNDLFKEITNKYLSENNKIYNPIKVCIGIRIKIEKEVFNHINENKRDDFINEHGTLNKLKFAEKNTKNNYNIPEIYYILKPLYNDIFHLKEKDDDNYNINKIKAAYLKLHNRHIKEIIKKIFS